MRGNLKFIKKFVGGAVLVALMALPVFAGVPHTSWGKVTNGQVGDKWRFYLVAKPSATQEGALKQVSGSIIYQATVGNLDWSNGDDSMVFIAKETNPGSANHAGFYAIMNEDLNQTQTVQPYNDCTIRQIPTPTATAGAGSVSVSWTAAQTDASETPHGSNITGYNVYRSTSQSSGFTKINASLVTATNYTDTTGTVGTTYYFTIEPVLRGGIALGIISASSNGAAPSVAPITPVTLTYDPNRGNIFWVSVPYITPYTKASDIVADINVKNGLPADSGTLITSIGRWIGASNPQAQESYDYLEGLGWNGTNFNVVTGEAIFLNIAATTTFTFEGSHNPNFTFNLPYDLSRGNIFWVSLPYNGSFTDVVSIIADINASAGLPADSGALVSSIGRWVGASNPQAQESYDYLEGLGWNGTNFNFSPGDGYYVNITGNIDKWKPKVK